MLNFNHLYYFHVTASEGSVKGAAERIGVTQPTVSEQVRQLEKSLGVQLFDRSPSGLKLTQQGREALEHTRTMFIAAERLAATLGHTRDPQPTLFRVGVSTSTSRAVAADFLVPVLRVEGCRPIIRFGELAELLRDLRARALDLVLGETEPSPVAEGGLEVSLVHRPVLVAIAPNDLELAPDWQNAALLEHRTSSPFHWEVDTWLKANGKRPRSAGEMEDGFLMLEAVARGGFVAFVPRSIAKQGIQSRRVRTLATLSPSAGVHAVFHTNEALDVVRGVVEQLTTNARDDLDGS